MLMLPVIVWSPLEQYSSVVNRECPKCIIEGQNSQLTATSWTDGSSTEQPRLLYCVNSNVSRIYSCPNKHRVLGHNPGTNSDSACSRVTERLLDHVYQLCHFGLPLQQIETLWLLNRVHMFYSLKTSIYNCS